ncbi:F-box/LRR-repeat protein At3g58900-like [Solanum verrucosum]|uniref:F-box/LRR-repeat protein At3g58900-like n=1 Tax=Solanum verrucosum TaxID=315347 RepID=UPI0020D00FAA|nr:F-box/LRR-repeat protein At3g58900-like [Solanum verrucosum]
MTNLRAEKLKKDACSSCKSTIQKRPKRKKKVGSAIARPSLPKIQIFNCQKEVCIAQEDRISQLPDEILVYILSFFTVKEAADTSLLSRRWLNLWTYIDHLDFDATKYLDQVFVQPKLQKGHMDKYLTWVNSALQKFKGQRLDQFRVYFDLNKFAQHDIDKWLELAFSKKVQRLELDLLRCGSFTRNFDSCYTFPKRLLGLGDSSSCSNNLQILSLINQNFKSLKVLILKSVNVTGQVLEFFLRNCPFLERMQVHGSGTLKNLEVVGPSLKLRHLEIYSCFNVKSLKICDTNLISLRTSAGKVLLLKKVPMLVMSIPFEAKKECKKAAIKCPLHHLKVVKFSGFYTGLFQLELVRYFLENGVALEKIIIDPGTPFFYRIPPCPSEIKHTQASRNLAKLQLECEVPPAIKLVIL